MLGIIILILVLCVALLAASYLRLPSKVEWLFHEYETRQALRNRKVDYSTELAEIKALLIEGFDETHQRISHVNRPRLEVKDVTGDKK